MTQASRSLIENFRGWAGQLWQSERNESVFYDLEHDKYVQQFSDCMMDKE